jgi:hypothetical protein
MKHRLVYILAAALAALAIAGCGSSSSSSDSSGAETASVAPAGSPLFVEVAVSPEGELKSNIETLVEDVAGIDDLGGLIVDELEEQASDSDEPVDFATEIEPWLGERAGIFFQSYDGDDFHGYGVAVQTADADAAQEFIDKQAKSEDGPAEDGSYEGVDFKVELDDDQTVGMIDDLLVLAEDEATFKAAVDASGGDALSDSDTYTEAIAGLPGGSFADVYADVGGLIEQAGGVVDPQALQFLDTAGIDPTEMTVTASLVPGSDQIELDVSSDLGGATAPSGDVSELLGSLPQNSFAAIALAGFGKQLREGIDSLDASGIPGEIPPNKLKSTLAAAGIDLDKITGSLQDAALFAEGANKSSLGGALVFTTEGNEASNTVANIGTFLRAARVPGVTAIKGETSGFSVRSPDLGRQPLVVAAKGDRIAISYGAKAAALALGAEKAKTLADSDSYKAAVSALGSTPISGFADGAATLKLVESLISPDDKAEFAEAKPYLKKARFLAIGAGGSDGRATAKLILGFNE